MFNCLAVHSSMDEYLADWFGLNQSRYQWALNDYYESKGIVSFSDFLLIFFYPPGLVLMCPKSQLVWVFKKNWISTFFLCFPIVGFGNC